MDKLSPQVKVGYLLKSYPAKLKEAAETEILALHRNGVAVTVFYLRQSMESSMQPVFDEAAVPVREPDFLSWKICWRMMFTHSWGMIRHPWWYLKTTTYLILRKVPGRTRDLFHALYLSADLKRSGVQHLHICGCGEPADVAEIACELSSIRFSISVRAEDFLLLQQLTTRRNLRKPQFITTSCEYDRQYLQSLNTIGIPIHRVYQGLDAEWFESDLLKSALPDDHRLISILSIGKLTNKMGFDCLIKACAHLKAEGYRFRCDIVGTGPDRELLQHSLKKYDLTGFVHLRGNISPALLKAVFQRTNIFVLPYRTAGGGKHLDIPTVLLQAMAMAIPVVATKVPAISEIIEHQQNGVLVEPDSGLKLAKELVKVFENKQLSKRFGDAGQNTVEKMFHIDKNILGLKRHLLHGLVINKNLSALEIFSVE